MKNKCLLILMISSIAYAKEGPFPIQFSISEDKVIKEIPSKDRDFAFIVPGKLDTYIYNEEADYYQDYQRSYFAITCKKGGWDCMRHYEILANGCIPYFIDLDKCHLKTMEFLPRKLILEAMNLEGVSYPNIDHTKFNKQRYYEILEELLAYTRKHLTTAQMARHVLNKSQYSGNGTILYLSEDVSPDYMRCCTLAGLKQLLQEKVIDFPKIEHIYINYPHDVKKLYGKGFSYSRVVEDYSVDRKNIEQRIRNKEFEIIIYGSVHRGLLYHDLVKQVYKPENIFYICGEDAHECEYSSFNNLFLREFDSYIE